jgi:hypothetical protein
MAKIRVVSPSNKEGKILDNSLVSGILASIIACNPQSKDLQVNAVEYREKLDLIFSEAIKKHTPVEIEVYVVAEKESQGEYGFTVRGLYAILDLVKQCTVNKFRQGKGGKSASELEAISL